MFDTVTPAAITMAENHYLIHAGLFFTAYHRVAALANGANLDLLIDTNGANPPHLQGVEVTANRGPDTIRLYEDVTTSDDGTAVAVRNKNRLSSNTALASIYHTPTVTDLGTLLDLHDFPTAGRRAGVLEITGGNTEWILKANTKYLIRLINNSGGSSLASLHLAWYEPDPPASN